MSFLTRTLPRSLAASQRMAVQSRAFTVSSARMLKEDDRRAANEHHKQDQLKKQKEGKGHWKPELASNSEEAIAADRNNKDESPEELQKRTQHHAAEKHK
ncbi:hypothetical protein M7I_6593 [Glarea lozoyensis 74030]|uniref:Mitochondrial carrier n=1 Tax=Glarea lozoyensis (strain ATCC 74030 / MF5533) TaxID=1104152 RepID=H0EV01_GLAL7|nr:hypothetical protein M7I_6593 [Glarea lozoyensis 74030]